MAQPTNTEMPPESWLVAVAPNKTVMLTLDEMDAAYQAGHIGEHTLVWTPGMSEWLPLEEAAGGDHEEEESAAPSPAPAPPQQHVPSQQPVAQQRVSPRQPQPHAQRPVPVAPPEGARQNFARYDYAVAPLPSAQPMSTAPVAFNLESLDELDDQVFAKKKQSKWGLLMAAAVVCGGVGFTVANPGGMGEETVVIAASQPPVAGQAIAAVEDAPLALSTGAGYQVSPAERSAIEKQLEKEKEAKAMKDKMAEALAGKKAAPEPVGRSRGRSFRKQEPAPVTRPKGKAASFDPLNGDLP